MAKRRFTIQGKDYTYRPYNRATEEALAQIEEELMPLMKKGEIDRFDYYERMLDFIARENVEIDVDTLDAHEAEEAFADFLPPTMRLSAQLLGY